MTALQLAARDDRLTTTRSGVRWREGWQYPDETTDFLSGLIKKNLARHPGRVLHVCSGASMLGDDRVDMFHPRANVKGDAQALPFRSGVYAVVLIDSPWPGPDQGGWSYDMTLRVVQECGRVLAKGGVLIVHAPWMPRPSWAELEPPVFFREDVGHAFPKPPLTISVWRRTVDPPANLAERGP